MLSGEAEKTKERKVAVVCTVGPVQMNWTASTGWSEIGLVNLRAREVRPVRQVPRLFQGSDEVQK